MKNIPIKNVMTRKPICVTLDDRLYVVRDIFNQYSLSHLLVQEEGELIGIVSDRELFRNVSPNVNSERYTMDDFASLNQPVHKIVTRHPVTLPEHATLKEAVTIFNKHQLPCIPVIDNNKAPVGILHWHDVMRHITFDE